MGGAGPSLGVRSVSTNRSREGALAQMDALQSSRIQTRVATNRESWPQVPRVLLPRFLRSYLGAAYWPALRGLNLAPPHLWFWCKKEQRQIGSCQLTHPAGQTARDSNSYSAKFNRPPNEAGLRRGASPPQPSIAAASALKTRKKHSSDAVSSTHPPFFK